MEEQDPQTFAIVEAPMAVHLELGSGFLESGYHEAFLRELTDRAVPFRGEVELPIFYKGERLRTMFRADLICHDTIVVELKAIRMLTNADHAQLLNYLTATGLHRGLLLNFGSPRLQTKRMVKGYNDFPE